MIIATNVSRHGAANAFCVVGHISKTDSIMQSLMKLICTNWPNPRIFV